MGAMAIAAPLAIQAAGVLIPAAVKWAEDRLGHSSVTGEKKGDEKMGAVVAVLQNALVTLANAGAIPSAPVVDPNLKTQLTSAVQAEYQSQKAAGLLDPPAAQAPKPAADSLSGRSVTMRFGAVTVTGTIV